MPPELFQQYSARYRQIPLIVSGATGILLCASILYVGDGPETRANPYSMNLVASAVGVGLAYVLLGFLAGRLTDVKWEVDDSGICQRRWIRSRQSALKWGQIEAIKWPRSPGRDSLGVAGRNSEGKPVLMIMLPPLMNKNDCKRLILILQNHLSERFEVPSPRPATWRDFFPSLRDSYRPKDLTMYIPECSHAWGWKGNLAIYILLGLFAGLGFVGLWWLMVRGWEYPYAGTIAFGCLCAAPALPLLLALRMFYRQKRFMREGRWRDLGWETQKT